MIAYSTNHGKRSVHLTAPGDKILSTIPVQYGDYGALSCADSTVLGRLRPLGTDMTVNAGINPIELSVLHINCASPNGNVIVKVSPTDETIVLMDDGIGADLVAGDDNATVNVDGDLQANFPVKS